MESSENVTVEYLPQEPAVTRRPELIPNRSDGTRFLHSEFDGMNQQRCEKERERERDRDPERDTHTLQHKPTPGGSSDGCNQRDDEMISV